MMYPPVMAVCSADAGVQAALGSNPCRLYVFGEAKGLNGGPPQTPYAVWQVVSGAPENYLGERPDTDGWSIQFDVYAPSVTAVRAVAEALRDAIEPVAHIVSWRGESQETETKLYRFSFDVDWIEHRESVS